MRLLSKQEFDRLKGMEKQFQIQDGKRLAEKVDALRELSAKEESSLRAFKEQAIEAAKAEIIEWTKKRDAMVEEQQAAEAHRDAARLATKDRTVELNEREEKLEQRDKEQHEYALMLADTHSQFEEQRKDIVKTALDADAKKSIAEADHRGGRTNKQRCRRQTATRGASQRTERQDNCRTQH